MSEKSFEILYQETLFQGFYRVDRYHMRQELFLGGWSAPFAREVFNGAGQAAVVLLFDPHHDKVVMIEQFRTGPMVKGDNPFLMELVAGMVDPGETPETTARREALEEAGCKVMELQKLFSYYPSPGGSSEFTTLYVGRTTAPEDGEIHGLAGEGEDIRVHVLDAAKAINMLYTGQLHDASALIAMQWFALHHTELRSRWLVSESSMPII